MLVLFGKCLHSNDIQRHSVTFAGPSKDIRWLNGMGCYSMAFDVIRMPFDDTRRTFERQSITLFRWHSMTCDTAQWHWNCIQWRSKNIRRAFETFDDIEWHVMLWWRSNAIRWHSKDIRRHWIAGDAIQWLSKDIRTTFNDAWRHWIPCNTAILFNDILMTFDYRRMWFEGHSKDFNDMLCE